MDRYIIDLKTGRRYELAGCHSLLAGTRLGVANSDDGKASVSRGASKKEDAATHERPAIGRFGRAHGNYLKRTQHQVYSQLAAEGKLDVYLAQIDEQANAMLDRLIRQMAKREGVTEDLKAADQMEWVRRMNSICNRAEEVISRDILCN